MKIVRSSLADWEDRLYHCPMLRVRTPIASWVAVLAAPILFTAQPVAAKERPLEEPNVTLAASSKWHLNYADDSCRLARSFGEGEDRTMFYIERYGPGDTFMMVVAGSPLEGRNRKEVRLRFGPGGDEEPQSLDAQLGDLGSYAPALIIGTASLRSLEDDEGGIAADQNISKKAREWLDTMQYRISPETEAAIEWVDIARRAGPTVRLQLGSMGQPMAEMRKCTQQLMTDWGIDVAAHASLTRPVVPTRDPSRWLTPNDYPMDLVRDGAQGIVKFRLSIDESGKPTQCHIQQSTRPQGFDDVVCKRLMERARFEPALGEDGQAIASFWRSTVRFQL